MSDEQAPQEVLKWGDSLDKLSQKRKDELAKRLWEWKPEMATKERPGPFGHAPGVSVMNESLSGLEVFWLAICALAGPSGDGGAAEQRIRTTHLVSVAGLHLEGADLFEAHLRGAVLYAAHLEGAMLTKAHLESAVLIEAHLQGAEVRNADLERARLMRAHLENADLFGARLDDAILSDCYAEHANLSSAHLERVHLQRARLDGADLSGASLKKAIFTDAHLDRADLTRANLDYAELNRANLRGAILMGAHLKGAILRGAHMERASLIDAYLVGADLRDAHLEDAKLAAANMGEARMRAANAERAFLYQARMEKADLSEVRFEGAILASAHLEGATLLGAHLEGKPASPASNASDSPPADLRSAFFDPSTNLTEVTLGDGKLGFVSLVGTHWGGTDLSVVKWSHIPGQPPRKRLKWVMLGDERLAREANKKAKDASRRLYQFEAAVRANRQLATSLRDQGLNDDADRFAYQAQVLQRIVLRRQGRYGAWIGSYLLDRIAGYGYKAGRSLFTYLAVLLVFAGLYLLAGNGLLTFGLPPSQYDTLPWYEALILSVSSFHGRGFFQPLNTIGDPVAILASIEAVFGLFIEVSFIATFTQRFFGK